MYFASKGFIEYNKQERETRIDNKQFSIESMNKNLEETCYCSSKSPWIIGGDRKSVV